MCDFDGEYAQLWHANRRRARKQYRCSACREPINAGDRYEYSRSLYEDLWTTYRRCERCVAMYKALREMMPREDIAFLLDCDNDPLEPGSPMDWLAFATPDEMQAKGDGR